MNTELCIRYMLRDNEQAAEWNRCIEVRPWAMNGQEIGYWNADVIGLIEPSKEELQAMEPDAIAWDAEQKAKDVSALRWQDDEKVMQMLKALLEHINADRVKPITVEEVVATSDAQVADIVAGKLTAIAVDMKPVGKVEEIIP